MEKTTEIQPDDWRRQEQYLSGRKFVFRDWYPPRPDWDHDHCAFCGAKFSLNNDDDLKKGYATEDDYHWVCAQCFNDFRCEFDLVYFESAMK